MSDEDRHKKKKSEEPTQGTDNSTDISPGQAQGSAPSEFISDFERKLEGENMERVKRKYLRRLPSSVRKRYFK